MEDSTVTVTENDNNIISDPQLVEQGSSKTLLDNSSNNEQEDTVESVNHLEELKSIKIATCFKCGVWSENPDKPGWNVKLMLHSEKPLDLSERIGFIVLSNFGGSNNEAESADILDTFNFKFHSRHDIIDNRIFRQLVSRGNSFTKLELVGGFFNNAHLCPSNVTPTSDLELISLPNLKSLIIKTKITAALKGNNIAMQEAYYQQHIEHYKNIKLRTAKNLWFIVKSLNCPKLNMFELQDSVNWEDEEMKTNGFNYWEQPLIDFLQRHAESLKVFKATPLVIAEQNAKAVFNTNIGVPEMQDLLFWMKFHLTFDTVTDQEKELYLSKKLAKVLRPWRQFIEVQNELQTLAWITDSQNPWPFMKKDFIHLCHDNPGIETLLMALHGDQVFKEAHNLNQESELPNVRDYQIDALHLHGMAHLKVLSIGCYNSDPQMNNFFLFNLQLLSPSIENVHLFGIRVMSNELEYLAKLPILKSLSIVHPSKLQFNEHDEVNKNVEGVTENVLKKLIHIRSLEKLVIVGFPVKVKNSGKKEKERAGIPKDDKIPQMLSTLGGICGGMCLPSSRESDSVVATDDRDDKGERRSTNMYSESLQKILTALEGAADIKEVQNETDDQLIKMLRMGDEINEPFQI